MDKDTPKPTAGRAKAGHRHYRDSAEAPRRPPSSLRVASSGIEGDPCRSPRLADDVRRARPGHTSERGTCAAASIAGVFVAHDDRRTWPRSLAPRGSPRPCSVRSAAAAYPPSVPCNRRRTSDTRLQSRARTPVGSSLSSTASRVRSTRPKTMSDSSAQPHERSMTPPSTLRIARYRTRPPAVCCHNPTRRKINSLRPMGLRSHGPFAHAKTSPCCP